MTQTMIGTTFLAGFLHLAVSTVVPTPPAPPPIVINSLSYSEGMVVQDRTVNTDGKFPAIWDAEVRDERSGNAIQGCVGEGHWRYSPGNFAAKMPLAEWVGSETCRLPPGRYQLYLRIEAGQWSTDARSDVFEVPS